MRVFVHRDSTGRPLEVGQFVAYNMSGDVVPGEIVGLVPSAIKIWYLGDRRYGASKDPHVSKVRSGRSVLIIPPETSSS